MLEVVKQCDSKFDAINASPVFRLFCAFDYHMKQKSSVIPKKITFHDWLTMWSDYKNGRRLSHGPVSVLITQSVRTARVYEAMGVERAVKRGLVNEADLDVASEVLNMSFTLYQRATIFGINFTSRGTSCRERKPPLQALIVNKATGEEIVVYKPRRAGNILNQQYHKRKQYSSFCLFYTPTNSFKKSMGHEMCGQFNFFFRLSIPSDTILDGVPMASIVSRKLQLVNRVRTLQCIVTPEDNGYHNEEFASTYGEDHALFIPLTNVKSTAILLGARTVKNKPIFTKAKNAASKKTENNSKYCSSAVESVFKLHLIPLHSSRNNVTFSNTTDGIYKRSEDKNSYQTKN